MQTIHIDTDTRDYDVLIGKDILGLVGEKTRETAGGTRAFLVSNVNVDPLYGKLVTQSLEIAGYEVSKMVVGAGEFIKNMGVLSDMLERMAEAGLGRDDVVVALGGGVVGDLAGFAAAVYMRGCKVVQVPTSLLAMVDSSVGGKTAVDLKAGKNLAGAFFQPRIVIASLNCLGTINKDLFTDSCGEVIKYGVMYDQELFDDLSEKPLNDGDPDYERLEEIVSRCVEIKRDVVNEDEKETGLRQILNLGHTIGHAIEIANDYRLGHGASVAAGMCYIARACSKLGVCSKKDAQKIVAAVESYDLPTTSEFSTDELYAHALSDKKRHGDYMNVVMIKSIGEVYVEKMPLPKFKQVIELGKEF